MNLTQVIVQLCIAALVVALGLVAIQLDMGGVKEWTAYVLGVLFLLAGFVMLSTTFFGLKEKGLKSVPKEIGEK